MLGYILIPILNICLYFGMVHGDSGALNIAVFLMWVFAIINFMSLFAKDEDLLKTPDLSTFRMWVSGTMTGLTIVHSVYWGFFFVPSIWLFSRCVYLIRKYELNNRKRF